jgi:hypothetical protein
MLKTLKDLKDYHTYYNGDDLNKMILSWIKGQGQYMDVDNINFSKCPKCGGRLEYTYEKTYDCVMCDEIWEDWKLFLIHIFNITEEELKEQEK